jgi:transposase-like protein
MKTHDPYIKYAERLRWGTTPACPVCCGSARVTRRKNHYFRCNACSYDFTVRTGTILAHSHAPMREWIRGIKLLAREPEITGARFSRKIGVTKVTARRMLRLLRQFSETWPKDGTTDDKLRAILKETDPK